MESLETTTPIYRIKSTTAENIGVTSIAESVRERPLEPAPQNHFGPADVSKGHSPGEHMMGPGANANTTRLGTQEELYVLGVDKTREHRKEAGQDYKTKQNEKSGTTDQDKHNKRKINTTKNLTKAHHMKTSQAQ